jgi:hypothetical protein
MVAAARRRARAHHLRAGAQFSRRTLTDGNLRLWSGWVVEG